jgi:NitT/TauT family transport system permease protein
VARGGGALKGEILMFRLGIIAVVFVLWEMAKFFVPSIFLSPPSQIVITFVESWDQYLMHLRVTLTELFVGFLIAFGWGTALGLIIGSISKLEKILEPLIMAFYSVPIIALAPLLILILGIGYISKVAIAGLYAGFPVLINTISGVKSIDPIFIAISRSFNLKRGEYLRKVALPCLAPYFLASLRLCLTFSLIAVIVGEFVASQAGLGWLINFSSFTFATPYMYGGILILAALGYCFNMLARQVEVKFFKWYVMSRRT